MILQVLLRSTDQPKHTGKTYTFVSGKCLVGRKEGHLRVEDSRVSGRHCLIFENRKSEVCVTDLDSRNGTFVNGERVQTKVLKAGDVIKLGSHSLEVLDPSDHTDHELMPVEEKPQVAGIEPGTLINQWPDNMLSLPKKQQQRFDASYFTNPKR